MEEKKTQLTSVKVETDMFDEFKINTVKFKTSLNKLVSRAMDLYNTDEDFRRLINNHTSFNRDKNKTEE